MNLHRSMFAVLLLAIPLAATAQSTLEDPYPLIGNQAESLMGTAGVNSAIGHQSGQIKTPPAEFARRKSHTAQASQCRAKAEADHPRGSEARKAARERCNATLKEQKATWYDKSKQAK